MHSMQSSNEGIIDRTTVINTYLKNRQKTQELFALLSSDAYYEQPIPLRHPIVFYEGHIPAFSVNCLLKKGLGLVGIDPELELLFARGIDPSDKQAAQRCGIKTWPDQEIVQDYARSADVAILKALKVSMIESDLNPVLDRGQGVFTILEHEVMHQETLLYMWHRIALRNKECPVEAEFLVNGLVPKREMVRVPKGRVTLGSEIKEIPFGWDNEFPTCIIDDVPAFDIDIYNITNQDYMAFVEAGGYSRPELWSPKGFQRKQVSGFEHPLFWERQGDRWMWRGMFDQFELPASWPVYVTHDEAMAYATWKGMRLPSEVEFHRAAYGTPDNVERYYPWGDTKPDKKRGNFGFQYYDPVPVGSYPDGTSAWGVTDLVGNGWEWTSTVFHGFSGFKAMASYPEYSADFFDGDHFVVKGASPATGHCLIRRSFRNWFRPDYPYAYATFRCVRDA